ncbi:ADP-ribosylglycohydrolase [Rhypophila decipiens]|uniref:ADP-ribosylglycohydrolase n=1 Tax=Rhypophila decipiens TaxID=261697 RepID=A0AAN6XWG4_9PEZI|nr:ADP-ribosylglycohydrolase [Rhypophila decipiens]
MTLQVSTKKNSSEPEPKLARLDTLLYSTATNHLLREILCDRVIGCMIGSALGDTIGLYTEFLSGQKALETYPSGKFTLTGGPNGDGPTPFLLDLHRASKQEGHWTDDTDHALLLVLGWLNQHGAGDGDLPFPTQQDLANRLRVWVQQGLKPLDTMPMGLGRLVGSVVASKGFLEDPEQVAREYWVKTGKKIAPNGSLMRTHPLGVMGLWEDEEVVFCKAAELSRVTHVDLRCVLGCVLGTGLVRGLLRGEVRSERDLDAILGRGVKWVKRECLKGDVEDDIDGEFDWEELNRYIYFGGDDGVADLLGGLQLDEPTSIGYVYKTLGSGVMLLRMAMRKLAGKKGSLARSNLFEELITDLIMRGGDADTNACFAGALLGAYLGYQALPDHWKHGLVHGEWLTGKAEAMCQVLGLKEGDYVGKEDKDTWPDAGKEMISQQEMEVKWMLLQQKTGKRMGIAISKAEAAAKTRSKSGWTSRLPWQAKDTAKS